MKRKLTKQDEKKLADFLKRHRQQGALNLLQTQGFLFAVVCDPHLVKPSDWLPVVLGEDTEPSSRDEAEMVSENLMVLYNRINNQVRERKPKLPKECRVLPDPLSNFEPPAPIHEWSKGFMLANRWLEDDWREIIQDNEELSTLFNMYLFGLGAPADKAIFEDAMGKEEGQEPAEIAGKVLQNMPKALQGFAEMAMILREVISQPPDVED